LFGEPKADLSEPGLHFHWPAPIGGTERVPVGRVQRIVVGPSVEEATGSTGAGGYSSSYAAITRFGGPGCGRA
jgi:hypothetical protein